MRLSSYFDALLWFIPVVIVGLLLVFFLIGLPLAYRYIRPWSSSDRKDFIQLILLGFGGIVGVGTFISAVIAVINAQSVENQRAEATLLQTYLQQMGDLVTSNKLPQFDPKVDDEEKERIKQNGTAQTLAVLRAEANPNRKRVILRYLYESSLILKAEPVVYLNEANFEGANLKYMPLRDSNLRRANLRNAELYDSSLIGTDFYRAYLTGADLRGANFTGANLTEADLTGAYLDNRTNFTDADLSDATGLDPEDLKKIILSADTTTP